MHRQLALIIVSTALISGPAAAGPHVRVFDGNTGTAAQGSNPKTIRAKCFSSHMHASETRRCAAMLQGSRSASLRWAPGMESRAIEIRELRFRPAAAGRAAQGTLRIRKPVDKASPLLARAAASGRVLPQVVLIAEAPGTAAAARRATYMRYELKNVVVASYGRGGDRPTESLALNFTKIEFRNVPMSPDR